MKLRRDYIEFISHRVMQRLVHEGYIRPVAEPKVVEARISHAIVDDLSVEDRLNDEVREILAGYAQQMRQQNIEYHEMFQIVKRKLIKERNLVL